MTNRQINQFNSLVKSDDFLDDNSATFVPITQIGILAAQLKSTIADISTAAGFGTSDSSGVAEDKRIKRATLTASMHLVGRGAAAYFLSANMLHELRIVDYTNTELKEQRDSQLYTIAKELHQLATLHVANLINVSPAQVAQLDTDKEAFFDVSQDPKRQTEKQAVQNALIDPKIKEGMDIRNKIDIYMQTFIATNAPLYDEWKLSLSIDDLGGGNANPDFSISFTVNANDILSIDYAGLVLQGNSEVKLLNPSAGKLIFGFGPDANSLVAPATVNANSNLRKTCASLGYDPINATFLNVQNPEATSQSANMDIYLMD